MSGFYLAQYNIAKLVAPLDNPIVKEFVDNLDAVNAQADQSPGFIWRLQTEAGDSTDIEVDGDPMMIVNMSVWESVQDLKDFAYRNPQHAYMFRNRKEWFEPDGSGMVLWWVPRGHEPSVDEGQERLAFLKEHGASDYAFNFRQVFPPPTHARG